MTLFKSGCAALLLWLFGTFSYANVNTVNAYSAGELERLLAPIALYPDTVLTHILIASTYPLEVIDAERWVKDNRSLGGQAAVDGVSHKDWDPSVKALVAFPDLLERMSDDLDWLQGLGEAFLADEPAVLGAVQRLREQAYASGHLDKMQHTKVIRETRTIYIEPVEERVVYLPYYDPVVVYGNWYWPHYPPVYWGRPVHALAHGHFYWGPRYSLSTSFYFGAIAWPRHTVVILHQDVRPVHYRAHHIAHHQRTKRWVHNPVHRRNVAYRDHRAHAVFGDPRLSDTRYKHLGAEHRERKLSDIQREYKRDNRHNDTKRLERPNHAERRSSDAARLSTERDRNVAPPRLDRQAPREERQFTTKRDDSKLRADALQARLRDQAAHPARDQAARTDRLNQAQARTVREPQFSSKERQEWQQRRDNSRESRPPTQAMRPQERQSFGEFRRDTPKLERQEAPREIRREQPSERQSSFRTERAERSSNEQRAQRHIAPPPAQERQAPRERPPVREQR